MRSKAYIRRSLRSRSDPGDVSRDFRVDKVVELAGPDAADLDILDGDWARSVEWSARLLNACRRCGAPRSSSVGLRAVNRHYDAGFAPGAPLRLAGMGQGMDKGSA